MIYPEDKDQFIAAASLAWGVRHPDHNEHVRAMGATADEAKRYYVVPLTTFHVEQSESGEDLFGKGQGTHRAYMLYRLMRKDQEQLVGALKNVRRLMRLGKPKGEIYKVIDDAIVGRD